MLYLTNSFSLNMVKDIIDRDGFVELSVVKIPWNEVVGNIAFAIEDQDDIVPAIGHEDTAKIVVNILYAELDRIIRSTEPLDKEHEWYYEYVIRNYDAVRDFLGGKWYNRINISVTPADTVIVCQYTGTRLPEGSTQLPEGAKIEPYIVQVEVYGSDIDW